MRDDVSTDEITPLPILTHYDDQLGRYPYTGFRADGAAPIGIDAVRAAGIEVVVAGKRYGKGSSREHSPAAEKLAGVRLVIAESFERIYRPRENARSARPICAVSYQTDSNSTSSGSPRHLRLRALAR